MDEFERACSEFTSAYSEATLGWISIFEETSNKLKFYARLLRKDIRRLAYYLRGGKRPRYYHTGIEPKRQNRTRKKRRLTRLQRRWKRQRR